MADDRRTPFSVEISCVPTLTEAHLQVALLAQYGIRATVSEEPRNRPAMTGNRVFVAGADVDDAVEILNAPIAPDADFGEDQDQDG